MGREQRWAASGAVVLFLGLLTVRRVASGAWRWWAPAALSVVAAALSLVASGGSLAQGPVAWVLLLGFQSLALVAWAVLLWTPPVAPSHEPRA